MMALHQADPGDVEARSFAALATLGLASKGRDTATYMRAAALLEDAFPSHPDHPGVLHYLIHSYDDPAHAPLGLRAARRFRSPRPCSRRCRRGGGARAGSVPARRARAAGIEGPGWLCASPTR